jgi:hypothetical protein
MLWEASPPSAVAARLQKMGIESVVFETCAGEPVGHDYLEAMNLNAERLAAALRQEGP